MSDAVVCPRCGGAPDPEGGAGLYARCSHCGILGRIETSLGGPALAVAPAVLPGALAAIVDAASGVRGTPAALRESTLVWLPFWRIEHVVVGRIQGQRHRRRKVLERGLDEEGRAVIEERTIDDGVENVDREIQRVHVALVSGCPTEEYGVPTLDGSRQMPGRLGVARPLDRLGGALVFHDGLRAMGRVFAPLVGREHALAEAEKVLAGARAGFTAGLCEGARAESIVLTQETMLLYYPVHLCTLEGGSAAIDAVTGDVVALLLPAPGDVPVLERRMIAMGALVAGFVGASIVRAGVVLPAVLAGPGEAGLRARLVGGGVLFAAASYAGLCALARRMERVAPPESAP